MEAELLARARSLDAAAIREIVLAHQDAVRSYMARLAPDPATADDLAQEVFLVALRSFERIDPEIGIRPYLIGVARNLARLAWRERFRSKEFSGERMFATLEARIPDEAPADLRRSALEECLERLAPKALEILLRHYRGEERCDEIAERLGAKPGTVRCILARARRALRDCVKPKLAAAGSR